MPNLHKPVNSGVLGRPMWVRQPWRQTYVYAYNDEEKTGEE